MNQIDVQNLVKSFGLVEAVKSINFSVGRGEFVFLLGPSGCGKTTTLRMIAGLEMPTSGRIEIADRNVTFLRAKYRNVGMVFERYALYGHLSVFENIAYPLRVRRLPGAEVKKKVEAVAERLQIEDVLRRRPDQLSGGQAQRVAIGRMLVRDADVFLMDEPISHLDAKLRAHMRVVIKRLQKELNTSTLYVSHDQLEAMTMADRIVVMNNGEIQQFATPQEIFDQPANEFVAGFVGEPQMNIFDGELIEEGGALSVRGEGYVIPLDGEWVRSQPAGALNDRQVRVGVRPEHIELAIDGAGSGAVQAQLQIVETMGHEVACAMDLGGKTITMRVPAYDSRHIHSSSGEALSIRPDPDRIYLFSKADGRTLAQARGTLGQGGRQ